MKPLHYERYDELHGRSNVIADGSPTDGTVLSLTHWPGLPAPAGLARDTSAEIAFAYLDGTGDLHGEARLVSNNHFDQDGLVSVFALTRPDAAQARRSVLTDVATAGDFARYTDRTAARISMVLSAYGDPQRSPWSLPARYEDRCALLYTELLEHLPRLCDDVDIDHALWADEDVALTRSEKAIAGGEVGVVEYGDVDLAVVDLPIGFPDAGGHRFGSGWTPLLHPMAVYNATPCNAVLFRRGATFRLVYRYESWVRFVSRLVRRRRDLSRLAAELTADERRGATWAFDGVSAIEPALASTGESTLAPDDVVARVRRALADLPPAWEPDRADPSA